ncbi:hypothetical protein HELRODRAFT_132379, partial [Helobdella robusta]|uniref:G-protein coupled receptors family 1 profile domain-containing protein n=1 Tax=Helobdella robusta TaxID=6412 RepID=T1EHY2_HELRO
MYIHPHWDQYRQVAPGGFMIILGIYITIVAFIGTIGNMIVLWIFTTTPSLKTPSNMLVINLATCDLMFSAIIGFPMMALACFKKYWIWGFVGCQWYAFVAGVSGLVSINTLTAISIDRYMVIAKPLYMMQAASKSRSLQQIIFVWCYAIGWVLPPWFGWGAFMPEGFGFSCTWDYLTRTTNNISFNMCFVTFQFILPVSLVLICYVGIVNAVAQNRKEMGRMSKDTANQTKQEIQIAKVVAVNVLFFIVTWLPYVTVAMLGVAGHSHLVTPYTTEIPVMLAKASGAWNPIIYALSHPRYRDAL